MLRDEPMASEAAELRERLRDEQFTGQPNRELLISNEELGARFREYILESDHQSWDGHERRDLTGVERMLADFNIYIRSYQQKGY